MNSDTEQTTKVRNRGQYTKRDQVGSTAKKFVLELERHRFAEVLVLFENLCEDAAAKQMSADAKLIFAGNSICDSF